jgi:hypothetical protein
MSNASKSSPQAAPLSRALAGAPTDTAPLMSTPELWAATHSALCAGRWSQARALLDALGRREDNRDLLPPTTAYAKITGHGPLTDFAQLIQDRIDLVNALATRD